MEENPALVRRYFNSYYLQSFGHSVPLSVLLHLQLLTLCLQLVDHTSAWSCHPWPYKHATKRGSMDQFRMDLLLVPQTFPNIKMAEHFAPVEGAMCFPHYLQGILQHFIPYFLRKGATAATVNCRMDPSRPLRAKRRSDQQGVVVDRFGGFTSWRTWHRTWGDVANP